MPSKKKLDDYYMSLALRVAELSHGLRAKVGCCLVTDNDLTVLGTNGLPKQLGNELEYKEYNLDDLELNEGYPFLDDCGDYRISTKNEVIHAELNTILKCAKEGVSVKGATIYTTLSCCSQCASMLASCGVKRVVYLEEYRDTKGIEILKQCGIIVEKLESL